MAVNKKFMELLAKLESVAPQADRVAIGKIRNLYVQSETGKKPFAG